MAWIRRDDIRLATAPETSQWPDFVQTVEQQQAWLRALQEVDEALVGVFGIDALRDETCLDKDRRRR